MDIKVGFREHDRARLRRRLKTIGGDSFSPEELTRLVNGDVSVVKDKPRRVKRAVMPLINAADAPAVRGQLEQLVGESLDLVPVAYVTSARLAADAVCRVITKDRKAKGTGVLVAPGVILTNHHVIPDVAAAATMLAQFNHELNGANDPLPSTEFTFEPDGFFWTSPVTELDVTLVAVGPAHSGEARELATFGVCPMSTADDKHAVGDFVTIVQHPDGDYKQIGLRDNRVLGRGGSGVTLHYATDTLPGSSGSPVFNDQFNLVAVHHAGGPRLESTFDSGHPVPSESNEGIRISRILTKLQESTGNLGTLHDDVLDAILGH